MTGGGGRKTYLSVAIRWLMTAQASSGRAFLITSTQSHRLATNVYLRFNTATDNVNSPGRADQSAHHGILGNHGFDCPQSLIGFNRREDRFPHAPVDLSGMSGGADESVIEHVAYTTRVIVVMRYQDKEQRTSRQLWGNGIGFDQGDESGQITDALWGETD